MSDLPPVSYEVLEANNRDTHNNLNFCIQERDRLAARVKELEATLADLLAYTSELESMHSVAVAVRAGKYPEGATELGKRVRTLLSSAAGGETG